LPVNGHPPAALFALWLIGRVGIAASAICGLLPAEVTDVAFLLIFAGVALNEIVAGLGVLIIGNIVIHPQVIHSPNPTTASVSALPRSLGSSCWSADGSCRASPAIGWCETIPGGCRSHSPASTR